MGSMGVSPMPTAGTAVLRESANPFRASAREGSQNQTIGFGPALWPRSLLATCHYSLATALFVLAVIKCGWFDPSRPAGCRWRGMSGL